jgi:hypothetical protein
MSLLNTIRFVSTSLGESGWIKLDLVSNHADLVNQARLAADLFSDQAAFMSHTLLNKTRLVSIDWTQFN